MKKTCFIFHDWCYYNGHRKCKKCDKYEDVLTKKQYKKWLKLESNKK